MELRATLADLIEAEDAGALSPKERAEKVSQVQAAFLAAEFPNDHLLRLRATLKEVLPGVEKIKVRSSANAEDVANFDGAGLHDSFAADTDKDDLPDCCRVTDSGGDGVEVKRNQTEVRAVRGEGGLRQPVEQARNRGALVCPNRPLQRGDGACHCAGVRH